jgi:hypothetical protein
LLFFFEFIPAVDLDIPLKKRKRHDARIYCYLSTYLAVISLQFNIFKSEGMSDRRSGSNKEISGIKVYRIMKENHILTLKALPSVSLHFPPVGLERMFLQLLQATMVWAWLKTTAV